MTLCWGINEYLSLSTLIVLAITACVVVWYSIETRKLRIATEKASQDAERAREIEFHPWLTGSDLKISPIDRDQGGLRDENIFLPIKNEGKTPALNVAFEAYYFVNGKQEEAQEYRNLFISPNDTIHFWIARISVVDKNKEAEIRTKLSYSTHLNGSGVVERNFQYTKIRNWENKDSEYSFVLSTGERYPNSP